MHQAAIEQLISDVTRIPCSRILLSANLYCACLDEVLERCKNIGSVPPFEKIADVFVRGVRAEKCDSLSGAEYALVPKSPDSQITINGVPLEFIPPFQPVVPYEQRPFHHFDTQKLLAALSLCVGHAVDGNVLNSFTYRGNFALLQALTWSAEEALAYVAGKMLDPAIRKRVLEARVFEEE